MLQFLALRLRYIDTLQAMFHILKFAGLVSLLLLIAACTTDDPRPNIQPEPELDPAKINFQDPVIGQFNTYEEITFNCGMPITSGTRDLILEVIRVDDESITFLESSFNTPTQEYTATRFNGGLIIPAVDRVNSALFYFYGSDTIRLTAEPTEAVEQKDCVFYDERDVKFTGEYVASVDRFELDGHVLENMKAVSCVPLILEVDGYLLYNRFNLYGSMTAENFRENPLVRAYILK